MTLVYREEKKEVFHPNREQLGPGYYTLPEAGVPSVNTAPFNSSIQRSLWQEGQSAVGPGFYQTQGSPVGKQNPSGCAFKSQIQRFQGGLGEIHQGGEKQGVRLNVGQDGLEREREQGIESEMRRLYMTAKLSTIQQRLKKVRTIPSIPTVKESFGYQMSESNELILNKNPRQVMSRLDEMRNKKRMIEPKGVSWSKSKQERKPFQVSQNGFYLENSKLTWDSKTFKYFQPKQINSETRKLALLKLRYGEKFQDYYQDGKRNDWIQAKVIQNNPGPGHYETREPSKSPIKEKQAVFGSHAERFPEKRNLQNVQSEQASRSVTYQSPLAKQNIKLSSLPMADRFQTIGCHQTPGPGSYVQKNALKESNKFGREDRFCTKKSEQTPGPGFYCQTNLKSSNLQRFNSLNNNSKDSIILDTQSIKQKLVFMISSTGDLQQPIQRERRQYKPQFTNTIQQSIDCMKRNIRQIVNTQPSTDQEYKEPNKEGKYQGKLQKPKIPLNKRKPDRQNLGPGCYYKELPYGKPTFNVTYT